MTPRPVHFPDAVPDRANLFDRADVLTDVLDSLKHCTTVIRGGRLMGKTSLVNVLAQLAEDGREFAMISLLPSDSRAAFMAEILDGIRQWVDDHERGPARLPAGTRGRTASGLAGALGRRPHPPRQPEADEHPVATVVQFCQRIGRLAERASGVVFLLCVDQFDSLVQGWDEHEARLVLELIAHLDAMPRLPVRFLLTMSTIPDLVLTSFRSPLLNQSKIVTLEPWDEEEAASFTRWLADGRLTFDEAALAAMFAAAGGHPYFTKAVLSALLTQPHATSGPRQVTSADVAAAVRQAVLSQNVKVSLGNLVSAHLTADGVAVLDRAGSSQAGIAARGVGDLASAGQVLDTLQANGLLRKQGGRYLLRLGLWREWRAVTMSTVIRPPLALRIGRAARRIKVRRATSCALVGVVAGPSLAILLTTAYLGQHRTTPMRLADGAVDLAVQATYAASASTGDGQPIHFTVTNDGPSPVSGHVQVSFPTHNARLDGTGNGFSFTGLRHSQQMPRDIRFTTTAPASWMGASRARVIVRIEVSSGGLSTEGRLFIAVAPIPYMQQIQKLAGTVLVLFLVPFSVALTAEFVIRRRHEARASRARVSGTKGS